MTSKYRLWAFAMLFPVMGQAGAGAAPPAFPLPRPPKALDASGYPDCTEAFMARNRIDDQITSLQRCKLEIEQYRQGSLVPYERLLNTYNRKLLEADVALRASPLSYRIKQGVSASIREELERVATPDGELWLPYWQVVTKIRGDVPFILKQLRRIANRSRNG